MTPPDHLHEFSCGCGFRLLLIPPERPTGIEMLNVLSASVRETFLLYAQGRTTKEIGVERGLADQTIKNQLLEARDRLGVETTREAIWRVFGVEG